MSFYSKGMSTVSATDLFGYFTLRISPSLPGRLLSSNNERLFILSQLQNLLGTRSRISDVPLYRQLATHIDLLAYSITEADVQIIAFALSPASLRRLAGEIIERLDEYQYSSSTRYGWPLGPVYTIEPLAGPHDCLLATVRLHSRHQDWEFDRYSSIGFYLHDRRGDWMRLWRMSKLYDASPDTYRQLVESEQYGSDRSSSQQDSSLVRPRIA